MSSQSSAWSENQLRPNSSADPWNKFCPASRLAVICALNFETNASERPKIRNIKIGQVACLWKLNKKIVRSLWFEQFFCFILLTHYISANWSERKMPSKASVKNPQNAFESISEKSTKCLRNHQWKILKSISEKSSKCLRKHQWKIHKMPSKA